MTTSGQARESASGPYEDHSEAAESAAVGGAEGAAVLLGQASGIPIARPGPGQSVEISAAPGQLYAIAFNPAIVQISVEGNNLILTFADGGQIVLVGLGAPGLAGNAPVFDIAGEQISGDALFGQAVALTAGEAPEALPTLETAADAVLLAGTGATQYSDDTGQVIALLNPQGVIPPVFLEFGLIDLDPGPVEPPVEPPGGEFTIMTNETAGILQIPRELLLFLASDRSLALSDLQTLFDSSSDPDLVGPERVEGEFNATIDGEDTWVDIKGAGDFVDFLIGGDGPDHPFKGVIKTVEGEFTYTVEDGGTETDYDVTLISVLEDNRGQSLHGTSGDDVLIGDDGPNKIYGGDGNDIIYSSHDNSSDELYGGAGNDIIFFGKNDEAYGEGDDDTFLVVGSLLESGAGTNGLIDGGEGGTDTIILVDVLDDGSEDALGWLSTSDGFSVDTSANTITFDNSGSGSVMLADGSEIDFTEIESIVYS